MSFQACLDGHAERGTLTKGQIQKLKDEYQNMLDKRLATGNPDPVAVTTDYMTIVADRVAHERYAKRLHVFRTDENLKHVDEIYERWNNSFSKLSKSKQRLLTLVKGRPTKDRILRDLLVTADQRSDTLMAEWLLPLQKIIEKHSRTMNPFETRARMETFQETIRTMLNDAQATGDVAEMAGALRQVNDLMVREYRLAGGIMGKVENHATQVHDRARIFPPGANRADSLDAWKKFIRPLLDADKMIDFETGLPLAQNKIRMNEILDDIFESIVSFGEPDSKHFRGGDVMSRRSRMRALHFKNGDAFLEYNEAFGVGAGGLFDAHMSNIGVMARDVATMQILGPKSKAAFKTLGKQAGVHEGGYTEQMFRTLVGPSTMRDYEPGWLRGVEIAKNVIRSSLLDASGYTALNDVTFATMTADMHGMSAFKAAGRWTDNLVPGSRDMKLAMNGGHHVSAMLMAQSISMARAMEGDGLMAGKSVALNNWMQRASLMHHVTESTANAISQTYSLELGGLVSMGVKWADLDPKFQKLMTDGRLTQSEWDSVILKTTPKQLGNNNGFYLLPEDVASIPKSRVRVQDLRWGGLQEVARKISDIDIRLRFESTNAPTLKTRALGTKGLPTDNFERAAASAFYMFKSFPLQVMQNHFLPAAQRGIEDGLFNLERGGMTRSLMIVGTLGLSMGMLTLQMKEISKGRTPRNPETMEERLRFMKDAFIMSGFGGLAADVLLRDRQGRSMGQDLWGPFLGFAEAPLDILSGAADAIYDSATGESDYHWAQEIGDEIFRKARTYGPGLDLPYYQFAADRLIFDTIEHMFAPGLVEDRNERIESRVLEPRGQERWF